MSFVFFRKDCRDGQTQPPYPLCPAILSIVPCFFIQSGGKHSVGCHHPLLVHMAVLLGSHWKIVDSLWAKNAVLTSRALLATGALCALEGVFQLPDLPRYYLQGRVGWP